MHHLKKWFGIKDWQGPESSAQKPEGMSSDEDSKPGDEKIDSSNPTDAKNEQTIQTNNHIITDKIDLFKPIPENESIFLKYNNRLEAWLREHIPVEGDECAQCRIVKTGAFGAAYTGVMVYMHRLEKEAELGRRGHRLFRVFQICAAPEFNTRLGSWLREHIPVEKDECAQCRIVKTGAFGAVYTGVMVYMHKLEKEAELGRKGHRLFRVFQICAAPEFNTRLEAWLREHIPVERDECAQCRIVKTGAFGAVYTGVMVYMHRLEKEAKLGRKGHRLFRVFQICAAPALMINLYFYLFKTGYYQQRREGETNSEFQQRIHIEELQWYWDMFRKIRNRLQQNNSDDDQK